jgi:hypothetical protein
MFTAPLSVCSKKLADAHDKLRRIHQGLYHDETLQSCRATINKAMHEVWDDYQTSRCFDSYHERVNG